MATLTAKETSLIKDEIAQEELCIVKYEKGAKEANDPELKQLFSAILEHEKEHLKTLNRCLRGDIPDLQQESQNQSNSNSGSNNQSTQSSAQSNNAQSNQVNSNSQGTNNQSNSGPNNQASNSNSNNLIQNLPTKDSGSTFNGTQLNMFQNEMNVRIATEFGNELAPENSRKNDFTLCEDALTSEKYVSSTYNTSIFDCINTDLRKVLNHIQKDEQEHGEQITAYMFSKGFLK